MSPRSSIVVVALLILLAAGCGTVAAQPTSPDRDRATDPGAAAAADPSVIGLGDSVMAGTNCGCQGIVARYALREQVAHQPRIVPVNLGVNGATTSSLIQDLRRPALLDRVRKAQVVLLIIGANDLTPQLQQWQAEDCDSACYAPAVAAMSGRLGNVLATIRTARGTEPGAVLVLDYWNVFQDGVQTSSQQGVAMVQWGRSVTRLANRDICAQSTRYGDRCVDIYRALLGPDDDPSDLLAADGDHPNAAGVAVIVGRLVAATPKGVF